MTTGELVKKIRVAKGLKVCDVYKDIMARSTSYKYEKGLGETKISNLIAIVRRLNIDFSEFCFLLNKEKNVVSNITIATYREELINAFEENNIVAIENTEKKLRKQYKTNKQIVLKNLILIAVAMKEKIKKENADVDMEKQQIMEYLGKNSCWCLYEYTLLNDSLFMMNCSNINELFASNEKKTEFLKDDKNQHLKLEKVTLVFNILVLFIGEKKYKETKMWLKILNQMKLSKMDVEANFFRKFINGICDLKVDRIEKGLKRILSVLICCQELKLEKELNKFLEILKTLSSIYYINSFTKKESLYF